MIPTKWQPRTEELRVIYDPNERAAYERGDQTSPYSDVGWPDKLRRGRNTHGCFPEVAVRRHFLQQGYEVWFSEPKMPDGQGFVLLAYSGYRGRREEPYLRMLKHFPNLDEVNELGDVAKLGATVSRGGGDPDLFVFNEATGERFFVEVKDTDELHLKQHVCFPIIERELQVDVFVARVIPADADLEIKPL